MANVIKLKRGSGSDPSASDLVVGEVAIRTDSGKLFTKKDNGTIAEISGSGGGSDIFINTLSSSSGSGGGSATFNGTATRFTLSNPPSVSAQQLLVSIIGVVQKPNSGTSPSEGFAIDGNDIIFAAAPATGSDFFIVTYGSLNIAVPADNSVTSAKIVDGTIVGTDLATNIDLVDNQKIRFGTGNDLQISHDGTNNLILGSVPLFLRTSNFLLQNGAGNEGYMQAVENGAVTLYYANSLKFETTSGGIDISGDLVIDGAAGGTLTLGGSSAHTSKLVIASNAGDANGNLLVEGGDGGAFFTINSAGNVIFQDNKKAIFGAGSDLQIYHDGTNSYLQNGTGSLLVQGGSQILYLQAVNHEDGLRVNPNGSVQLFFDGGGAKFETTSNGCEVAGALIIPDGSASGNRISVGDAGDLLIFHDGTSNRINAVNGGLNLQAVGQNDVTISHAGEDMIRCKPDGRVNLMFDGSVKFFTLTNGARVTGSLWADGLYMDDNEKIHLGTSGTDLQIYHNGSASYIQSPSHTLYIQATTIDIGNGAGNEAKAKFIDNGAVELYYDNSKKIFTTANGIKLNDNTRIGLGNGEDLQIQHNGSHSIVHTNTGNLSLSGQNKVQLSKATGDGTASYEFMVQANANGAVQQYYDNSLKFETSSTGTTTTGNAVVSGLVAAAAGLTQVDNAQSLI